MLVVIALAAATITAAASVGGSAAARVDAAFTALAIGYVGWITIAVAAAIFGLVCQYLGF